MSTDAVFAYRMAWKALNTMLEEGRSYSGFESNCAFLNLGGKTPRFADISGACGLDAMDDGRSIAVVDWDFDGRLDFWVSNRTAPRIRLQHNRSRTPNTFVAVKLAGSRCNRDAIGARLELSLKEAPPQIRTLHAGDGFLAQSSAWVHFGIPEGQKCTGMSVRWPGGEVESFTGLEAGRFFVLEQGVGTAQPWSKPAELKPLDTLPTAPGTEPASERARIVMASPLLMPRASFLRLDGTREALADAGRPTLVNLWATWCAPCVAEMKGWSDDQEALRGLGIRVLALSVDNPDAPEAARAVVEPFVQSSGFPFETGLADAGFLEVLEVAGRAQIDKYESLPIPSSILLDGRGRIAVIYKGPVDAAQLGADAALLGADAKTLRDEAAHFPGIWIEGPLPGTPTTMIDKFMSFGQPEAAKEYLDQFANSSGDRANRDLAESYFLVANELRIQKNFPDALAAYAHVLELNPGKTRAHLDMGMVLFRLGRFAEASPHLRASVAEQPDVDNTRRMLSLALIQTRQYEEAAGHLRFLVESDPRDPLARLWLGHALVRLRDAPGAETQYRESLRLQPGSYLAANELAWLLATHTSAEIRKPAEALELARSAAAATRRLQPRVLDTLAAAEAASGDLAAAIATADQAIELARSAKDQQTLNDLQRRRKIYAQGRPYREIAPP